MSDITSTISSAINRLGTGFFFAYYVPAFIFTLLNVYLITPFSINPTSGAAVNLINALPTIATIDLNRIAELVGLPLIVAILLTVLNELFSFLFSLRFRANHARNELDLAYRQLELWRRDYRELTRRSIMGGAKAISENEEALLKLQTAIEVEHNSIASNRMHSQAELARMESPTPELQQKLDRTSKSDFGKALWLAKEYAIDHYRFDPDVFWPRLQILIAQHSPADIEQLSDTKHRVDLMLNLCVIASFICVEGIIFLVKNMSSPSLYTPFFLFMTFVSFVSIFFFYRSSTEAMMEMGELIKINIDRHRHLVAEMFGLMKPASLNEEHLMWEALATFIQRGDPFYFPNQSNISGNAAPKN